MERSYFGPWTLRDSACGAADNVGDPVGWTLGWAFSWRRGPGSLGQWKEAENASIDFYSFPRSDYHRTRRAELR